MSVKTSVKAVDSLIAPLPEIRRSYRASVVGKVVFFGYLSTLLWLLLIEKPFELLPGSADWFGRTQLSSGLLHLGSFGLLGALALAPQWFVPRWVVGVGLAGFALGTEWLQGFVPVRAPGTLDCASNLAGLALGAAVAGLMLVGRRRFAGLRRYPNRHRRDILAG